jgi:hypothetical protein
MPIAIFERSFSILILKEWFFYGEILVNICIGSSDFEVSFRLSLNVAVI